jgi:ribosomal protein L7/L12
MQLGYRVAEPDAEKATETLSKILEPGESVCLLVRGRHHKNREIDMLAVTDRRIISLGVKAPGVKPISWSLEDCEAIAEIRTIAIRLRKWDGSILDIGYMLSRGQDEKPFVIALEDALRSQPDYELKAKAIADREVRLVGFKFPDDTGRMTARRLNPFLEPDEVVLYVGSFMAGRGISGDSIALTDTRIFVFRYKDFGQAPTTTNRYENLAAFSCARGQITVTDHIGNQVVLGRLRHDKQDLDAVQAILAQAIGSRAASTTDSKSSSNGGPSESHQGTYDLRLEGAGRKPVPVIKLVRQHTQLELRDAKDLVEAAPVTLFRDLSAIEARALQHAFEEAGANVTLVNSGANEAPQDKALQEAEMPSADEPSETEQPVDLPAKDVDSEPESPEPVSAAALPAALPEVLPDGFVLGDFGVVIDHPPGAAGAFGRVYRVRRSFDDRVLAGKLYMRGPTSDYGDTADEGIRREVEALEALSHPNVVRVFGPIPVTSTGEWMILSEWLDGSDLVALTNGTTRNSGEVIFDLGAQLLSALAYLESVQVVHRDLKPANIMLTSSGQLKIIDFNLARGMGQITAIAGTQIYMPPDFMSLALSTDHFVDRYAAGVILFELLTQRHPYFLYLTSRTPVLPDSQPMAPERLRGDVSTELSGFLVRAVGASDANRFSTAGEMAAQWNALEDSIKGLV